MNAMSNALPEYVRASVPRPPGDREPWYKNTAPSYAGIFLWVGFYLQLANGTISQMALGLAVVALIAAGLLCFGLYYYAPAMLGMQTGRPLYIVGTSTFGTRGGYLVPGLLMGLLQLGWFAVATYVATDFIMKGLHQTSAVLFTVVAVLWAYGFAFVAIKGISYVARAAQFLNWVPLVMIVIVAVATVGGVPNFHPKEHHPWRGFAAVLEIVIGFSAAAGAAGADFGMNNRDRRDIVRGGLVGIALAIVVAGALPLLSIAGMHGRGGTSYDYADAIASVGDVAPIMFFLFAAATVVPTCFCAFIASNSFATMLPRIPKTASTLVGVTIGALLAVTHAAQNLIGFFVIVGASFGPICGAMAADYLLAGKRWSGPRAGINWAGYIAWALGFIVGILNHIPGVPAALVAANHPAGLYAFVVGFAVYWALAKAGLRPAVVPEFQCAGNVESAALVAEKGPS
ncbi:cytosine permease [Paraburkholderia sp. CI2]|uniref:cytosine permease n=1 Tax=Paraburkholderia sp. CI2 TaxID=2723093 RepID=UPI0016216176|nr:cytosine permease [Paraburkholderia sp. CI2]MBB5464957.1 cytosine permease [Paraburkholderia sp. CI2]